MKIKNLIEKKEEKLHLVRSDVVTNIHSEGKLERKKNKRQ